MDSSYRPVFHFTPLRGWMNDPNGLVFHGGLWHLFYQHYDPVVVDGMMWGHAVSPDLMRWTHLAPALYPDALGQIWSGSAAVDERDESGLCGGRPGVVCAYTYWNPADGWQCQGLAGSADGQMFAKYAGNPVIPELRHLPGHPEDRDFRDPKIFRHAPAGRWVMAVAGGKLRIFTSKDLRTWEFASLDESLITECPDLFPLQAAGSGQPERWVLVGGGRWYRIGEFDGGRFHPVTEALPLGRGPDFYASQTWNDAPEGRRVMISWLYGWSYGAKLGPEGVRHAFPTDPFAGGCLSVPTEVSLVETNAGPRLRLWPVRELATMREPCGVGVILGQARPLTLVMTTAGSAFDLDIELKPGGEGEVAAEFPPRGRRRVRAGYDRETGTVFIDRSAAGFPEVGGYASRTSAPVQPDVDGRVRLRLLFDRCSVELFAQSGEVVLSAHVLPDPVDGGLGLAVTGASSDEVRWQLARLSPPAGA